MKAEGLSQVEEVFHRALALTEEERHIYLEGFAPGEQWLVSEVNSLIEAYYSSPEMLDEPAFEFGLAVINDGEKSLVGQTIGSYRILSGLGKGGMGDVYLAEDIRLNRKVALKFLSAGFSDDAWARRQIIREAQAVAMLDHKNICALYGYEEIADHRFIVMQYIDGKSLAQTLRENEIDSQRLPSIALEVVEAIAEAHAHGILHRDIKPGNIMIAAEGPIKVLDFGLAKFLHKTDTSEEVPHSRATKPGLIVGTVAYMSPEQLKTEKLDFRSDIFSIGTVLFELYAGKHPFERKSEAETISAILDTSNPVINGYGSKIPSNERRIIGKCLEKEKERRYQSSNELLLDLQTPRSELENRSGNYFWKSLISVLVLLVIGSAIFLFLRPGRIYNMAVITYQNETGDVANDYLADGIAESLSSKLASYGALRIKNLPSKSSDGFTQDPLGTARKYGLDLIITGKITREGDQFVLRTNVINASEGVAVRTWHIPFQPTELPILEERVAEELSAGLRIRENTGDALLQPRGASTENGEAFRQYLIGRYYWKKRDRENIKLAITAFERSVALDPGYSRPYAGLADSYVVLSLVAYGTVPVKEAMTKARAAARQALEIDPEDPQAHTSLGVVFTKCDWNWVEAEREFNIAIQTDPEYGAAHYWYSGLLAILGRGEESISEAKRAKELDPFSPLVDINLARTYYYARQYDKALEVLNQSTEGELTDKKSLYLAGLIYLQKGMNSEARTVFENISSDNRLFAAAPLGYAYARMGRRQDAFRLISELEHASSQNYVPPQEIAIIYVGLNDAGRAIRYLNASLKERHPALISLTVEPLFDPVRTRTGFIEIATEMGLK